MKYLVYVLVFLTFYNRLSAQHSTLDSLTNSYQNWRVSTLEEKVYLHTDRSSYLTGETLWFKAYRVEASEHKFIDWSKILYVELLDHNNIPVLQSKFLIGKTGGEGSIFLPTSLPTANYVLRAYTNWMKNRGLDFFFQQTISILNPFISLEAAPTDSQKEYDAQFFPEGGDLVYGLESWVGVRVAAKNGKGVPYMGAVVNSHGDTITGFKASRFGLSKFKFTPQQNQIFKIVISDENKRQYSYPIPQPISHGHAMHLEWSSPGKLLITVNTTKAESETVYLLVHTRQSLKIQKQLVLKDGSATIEIDESRLDAGISIFTLFDGNQHPICERLFFKQPEQKIQVQVLGNPYLTETRNDVMLDVTFLAKQDTVTRGAFSFAVYKIDSLDLPVQNITEYLFLTSDLSDAVESPDYYFGPQSVQLLEDIDNLMLTYGWRRFDWEKIRKKDFDEKFLPELTGHLITGYVTNKQSGQPVDRLPVYLSLMGDPINTYVSQSEKGKLLFETRPVVGKRSLIAQVKANAADYQIEIDAPFFNSVSRPSTSLLLTDRQLQAFEQRSIHMQVEQLFRENRPPAATPLYFKNFYGSPDETYRLDDYTRFPTLEEVLREYVPGTRVTKHKGRFQLANIDLVNKSVFNNNPLVLIDGVPVFDMDKLMEIDPLKLKQLDVVKRRYYLNAMIFDGIVSFFSYKGNMADFQPPLNTLLKNYAGLEITRQFFVPKYRIDIPTPATTPDARHVLFWEAGTLDGHTKKIQFPTSDIAGEYRIVIQALTSDGLPGSYSTTFVVK